VLRATPGTGDAASDSSATSGDVAISSEYQVTRSGIFGDQWIEQLDHTAEAVVMQRAAKGLSLLREHDTNQVIGKVKGIRVGADRVLRGTPRFSRNAPGQSAAADYEDDILTEVSIGYRIHEVMREPDQNGVPVYRATKWEPLEVSLVAVPADPSVGKGRSGDSQAPASVVVRSLEATPQGAEETKMADEKALAAASTDAVTQRNSEVADIMTMCHQHGAGDLAPDFIRNGASKEAVARHLLNVINQRDVDAHVPTSRVELTPKEQKRYSFARALAAGDPEFRVDASFEREVSEELRKSLPTSVPYKGGMLVPTFTRAGIDTSTTVGGDKLKFTQSGDFIEQLRNLMILPKLGVRVLSGLTGPVSFPRQTSAATAYWSAENPGSDITDSNLNLDAVTLAFKSLGATTSFSRQLLFSALSGSYDAEALIRDDLATVLAIAADLAGIEGSSSNNQPTGVIATSGIGNVAGGTDGLAPTYANIVGLETAITAANAANGSLSFVTNAKARGKLRQVLESTTAGANFLWRGGLDGQMLGYPAYVSNQIASNRTKGTSTTVCSSIVFGNWRELLMGEFGAMEFISDPYRLKKQAMIEVSAWMFLDFAVRHPASFAACKDVLTT